MAPLPYNTSTIVNIQYTSGGTSHTLSFRAPNSTVSSLREKAESIITVMRPIMANSDSVLGATYQLAGEDISNDLAVTNAGAGSGGAGTVNAESRAAFISLVGRTITGRRTRVTLYSVLFNAETEFRRVISSTSAAYQAFAAQITDTTPFSICGIDGEQISWKTYFNLGFNAYWQRAQR